MKIDDPNAAPTVAKTIDDQFRNSTAPTKTGTEKAFAAGFASMWGNVKLLMSTIGMAVVFAILLVTANAMMMNQRERRSEVAVMKTVGFSDRRVFGLNVIVQRSESILRESRSRNQYSEPPMKDT